jgi:hypothetical protein
MLGSVFFHPEENKVIHDLLSQTIDSSHHLKLKPYTKPTENLNYLVNSFLVLIFLIREAHLKIQKNARRALLENFLQKMPSPHFENYIVYKKKRLEEKKAVLRENYAFFLTFSSKAFTRARHQQCLTRLN